MEVGNICHTRMPMMLYILLFSEVQDGDRRSCAQHTILPFQSQSVRRGPCFLTHLNSDHPSSKSGVHENWSPGVGNLRQRASINPCLGICNKNQGLHIHRDYSNKYWATEMGAKPSKNQATVRCLFRGRWHHGCVLQRFNAVLTRTGWLGF